MKRVILFLLPVGLAALAVAAWFGSVLSLPPVAWTGPVERRYLGPVSFDLPPDFQMS